MSQLRRTLGLAGTVNSIHELINTKNTRRSDEQICVT